MIAFLFSPLGRYVGAALLLLAIVLTIYGKGRSDGNSKAIEGVNRQTERAIEGAHSAARTVDECYALSGMRWNVISAKCERDQGDSR